MKFLMLIQIANNPDYEAGQPPPPELMSAMEGLMGEWASKGAIVSASGLRPTSAGARVRLKGGKAAVTDGPFTEAKEVIGGFFVLEVDGKATAVEMTRRFVELHGEILGPSFALTCELRQLES